MEVRNRHFRIRIGLILDVSCDAERFFFREALGLRSSIRGFCRLSPPTYDVMRL